MTDISKIDTEVIDYLRKSRIPKDREVIQLIDHYLKVIRKQREEISLLVKKYRKDKPY